MAEPVIVPVTLEVTDIDTSEIKFTDAEKQISKSLSGLKKAISDTFSGIDPSAINKPIEKSMEVVKKRAQAATDAHLKYREALIRAGKSTQEYKTAISEANSKIKGTQEIINELSAMGVNENSIAPFRKELDELIASRDAIDPVSFIDKADAIELDKVRNTFAKFVDVFETANKANEKFNQTAEDNKLTDEYTELNKQLESYKKQLEGLDEKSRRMEALGATDKQWEALQYDVEQVNTEIDTTVRKMSQLLASGKASRFSGADLAAETKRLASESLAMTVSKVDTSKRAKDNQSPFTADYQSALDDLDKLEKKMQSLKEKSAKMMELGASKKQFATLAYDADNLANEINAAKGNLIELVNQGKAFKSVISNDKAAQEVQNITAQSDNLKNSLADITTNAKKAQGGLTKLGLTHPKLAAILTTATKIGTTFSKVMAVTSNVTKSISKGFGKVVKTFRNVTSYIGKMVSNFFGHKASSSHNTGLKKLTRNIMMFGLGFRTAYYAVKRLRTVFIEAFKVMGDQFDEVGQPIMEMTESFNRLKGSLATAFQPVAMVVMPILTRLMNYLSGVLEKIGEFTAVLTGQGHIYKAVAKDINSVTKAAKDANNQLGSYDKLEVIDKNDSGYDFEKSTVGEATSAASNFANMVKEAWEKADFTSVGVYVTEKLLGVLDNVEKNIIPKAVGFANRVLMSVNTFFDGFDSTAIGAKFGSIIDTVVYGIDWTQVGLFFANLYSEVWDFFNGLVNNIDWAVLGQSLSTGLISLVDNLDFTSLAGMVTGLTTGIITAIGQIDWEHIATTLLAGLQNVLQTLGEALASSDNPLIAGFGEIILTINETINLLKPALQAIIDALAPIIQAILPVLNKLLPPIAEIVTDIVTILLPPLVRLIEALLPMLTSIAEFILPILRLAINVVASALAGVIDIISVVASVIDVVITTLNVLGKALTGNFNSFKDFWSALLKAWKTPINSILSAVEGLVNGIVSGVNAMIKALNKISFDIPDWVPGLGGKKFGFNLKEISPVKIPRLAQGAVIPPNKEFLAMLGDQKSGTNIEAPLDTIKQALAEVLAEIGGGSKEPIILQVSGRTLAKVVWDEQEKRYKQTGRYAMT
jgi:phage-related protein